MLVSAGSMSTPRRRRARARARALEVVELHDAGRLGERTGGPMLPARGRRGPPRRAWRTSRRRSRGSSSCARAPRAAGDLPREADREAVRVGGSQGELPVRSPEPPRSSSPTGASSVGSMWVMPRAACSATARRSGPAMAGHRARVAEAEVDVLVPVHVRKRAPRASSTNTGSAGPLHHPVHRHAVEQRRLGLLPTSRASAGCRARSAPAPGRGALPVSGGFA